MFNVATEANSYLGCKKWIAVQFLELHDITKPNNIIEQKL